MKKLTLGIMTGLYLASCSTTRYEEDIERIMQRRTIQEVQAEKEIVELNLDEIVTPENRYHWSGEEYLERSLIWYNPSLRTLQAGLENKDLKIDVT